MRLFQGRHNTHVYSLQTGNIQINNDFAKIQLGEPIIFHGITNRSLVRGYLQEQGWLKCSHITFQSSSPFWLMAHKSCRHRSIYMTCRQFSNSKDILFGQSHLLQHQWFTASITLGTCLGESCKFQLPDILHLLTSWLSRANLLLFGGNILIHRKLLLPIIWFPH